MAVEFNFSPEEIQIRDTITKFAANEIAPIAEKIDREDQMPLDIFKRIGALGMHGISLPEAYGGSNGTLMMELLVGEGLCKVSPAVALSIGAHNFLCLHNIFRNGNEEQKQKYLPRLCSGDIVGAMGLTEPNAGSDAVGIQTSARRDGDYYILNGTKMFITNGPISDVMLVYAKTDKSKGAHGISAFIVEKDFPGYSVSKKLEKMCMRGSPTGEIVFEDCKVPVSNLIGRENEGIRIMMNGLDLERAVFGSSGLAIAQGAFELSLKYSQERFQFGKPICSFQLIQAKLADMYTQIQAARALVYWCVRQVEAGKKVSQDAAASLLFSAEMAVRVAEEAVQIHGGYGLMLDYPVQRYYRDAKLLTVGAGTSEVRRVLIAGELLKK